jgi:hypothetical protein
MRPHWRTVRAYVLSNVTDLIATDVGSYEKELQQNTLGANCIAMVLQNGANNRTFNSVLDAMSYIQGRIAEIEANLQDAITAALADSLLGKSEPVRRWLCALPYVVSGNAWWSQEVRSYF